jgi:hypothetical protein
MAAPNLTSNKFSTIKRLLSILERLIDTAYITSCFEPFPAMGQPRRARLTIWQQVSLPMSPLTLTDSRQSVFVSVGMKGQGSRV